jgi:hypothetical protein
MINAMQKGFAERELGRSIYFTAPHAQGQALAQLRLQDCTDATLKYRDQTVLVEQLQQTEGDHFEGVIKGFEPALIPEFQGMNSGERISFTERHVFTADKR